MATMSFLVGFFAFFVLAQIIGWAVRGFGKA
jgi:hypothetical protein